MKSTAIILAGGKGKRMHSDVPKQLIEVNDRPLLYYTLKAFENSLVDDIVLVVPEGEEEKYENIFVKGFGFSKIVKIVPGGLERYDSVYNALDAIDCDPQISPNDSFDSSALNSEDNKSNEAMKNDCGIILVHDGARAFIETHIINQNISLVQKYSAVVTAMPVKDTIKIVDANGFVKYTPNRETLWQIQTPQTFKASLLKECYEKLYAEISSGTFPNDVKITDDSMVVERYSDTPVKLIEGSYENIKVTTPEDLIMAERIL